LHTPLPLFPHLCPPVGVCTLLALPRSDTPPAVKEMIRMCWDNDRNTRLSASECYAMLSTAYAQVHTRPPPPHSLRPCAPLSSLTSYAMLSTAYAQVHTLPPPRAISLSCLSTLSFVPHSFAHSPTQRGPFACATHLPPIMPQLSTGEYDIFFSHRWANKPFLSHLHHLLCEHGYRVWYVRPPAPQSIRPHRSSPSCAHSSLSLSPPTSLVGP